MLCPGLPVPPPVQDSQATSLRALLANVLVSAPLLLLTVAVVSASKGARVGLLPYLRVSGSGSHIHVWPLPAVVYPSTGRPGGTGVQILGWWRFSSWGIVFPLPGFLHCLRNPSPCLLMPPCPPRGWLWRRSLLPS